MTEELPLKLKWELSCIGVQLERFRRAADNGELPESLVHFLTMAEKALEMVEALCKFHIADGPQPAPRDGKHYQFLVRTKDGRRHVLTKKSSIENFFHRYTEADIYGEIKRTEVNYMFVDLEVMRLHIQKAKDLPQC